jgi:hypothetical protein
MCSAGSRRRSPPGYGDRRKHGHMVAADPSPDLAAEPAVTRIQQWLLPITRSGDRRSDRGRSADGTHPTGQPALDVTGGLRPVPRGRPRKPGRRGHAGGRAWRRGDHQPGRRAAGPRPAACVSLDGPAGVAQLLGALRAEGATSQASGLATRAAADVSPDDPYGVALLLYQLRAVGSPARSPRWPTVPPMSASTIRMACQAAARAWVRWGGPIAGRRADRTPAGSRPCFSSTAGRKAARTSSGSAGRPMDAPPSDGPGQTSAD